MNRAYKHPAKGRMLLSEPFLGDGNFHRSVILLLEHNDEGSVGFILNKPIDVELNEVIPDFGEFKAPVFMGGPVQQDSIHFLHRIKELAPENDPIMEGIYWGGNFEQLKVMARAGQVDPADVNFYIGYSGWAPGQLHQELQKKSWMVSPGSEEFTFADSYDDLWRDILRTMGPKYKVLSNYPEDPADN